MSVRFSFDGREIEAREGTSLAAALLEAGETVLSRSSKYRRPRGVSCARGHCPNCMVRVDGMPDVRACMVPVRAGMEVETEGSTARKVDVFRTIDRLGPVFPVGFQYRWFKRQNVAWRLWEGQLRKLAAETEIPPSFEVPEGLHLSADLLVVGAGPAGLAAADAAASAGLTVVLAGRRARLGGQAAAYLGREAAGAEELAAIIARVEASEGVTVLAPGTVVAAFEDRYVVDCGERAAEVTAAASVLATGAYERSLVFPGNDRPGVMLASGLRRLVLEDGALRDRSAAFVVADDSGLEAAAELREAGMNVAAVVDLRDGARVTGVKGRGKVAGLAVEDGGTSRTIACDLVAISGGWQRADELRYVATSDGDALVVGERASPLAPEERRQGQLPRLQGVGAVAGSRGLAAALAEGAAAGAWAARDKEGSVG